MADEERSRREVRILPAVLGAAVAVAIAVGVVAYAAGHYGERTKTVTTQAFGSTPTPATYPTVSPQVAAGAHTFVQFACAQCHGMQGQGGVDPAVPALSTVGRTLTVAQLTRAGLPRVADTQPVSVPQGQGPAVAGAALYLRYGCVNCHGPNGLGGIANPLSHDKVIPPLSGQGFRHDFPTDTAIAAVIRSGSVIGRAPIVSMPHWGGILSNGQIAQLIAYLKTLK
jgi:mono/diheme cytochrome c family protein